MFLFFYIAVFWKFRYTLFFLNVLLLLLFCFALFPCCFFFCLFVFFVVLFVVFVCFWFFFVCFNIVAKTGMLSLPKINCYTFFLTAQDSCCIMYFLASFPFFFYQRVLIPSQFILNIRINLIAG